LLIGKLDWYIAEDPVRSFASFAAQLEPYIAPKEKKVKFQRLALYFEGSALECAADDRGVPLRTLKAFFE